MSDHAGLYVHIPFCSRICPYCDFAVTTGGDAKRERFLAALAAEIDLAGESVERWGRFDTLYLGGGTPSALTPAQLGGIVEQIRDRLPLLPNAWLTLEANPEDVTDEHAAAWRELGFGTVSLGVQSLRNDRLEFLGRTHGADDARHAVERSRSAGFERVSVDLMFGAAGQELDAWRDELQAAIDLGPDHISLYQLTYHEGTAFWDWLQNGRRTELPEGEQADLYLAAIEMLGEAGYHAYEASNFARGETAESRHNRKYWQHLPYLGLGPSAHSFDGQRHRWWNARSLDEWAARLEGGSSPVLDDEELDDAELLTEVVMFGLRTRRGLDFAAIEARFGADLLELNGSLLEDWIGWELLEPMDDGIARPTAAGMAVADHLAAELRATPPDRS